MTDGRRAPFRPSQFGTWTRADHGESGDLVLRSPGGDRFAKLSSPLTADALTAERERLEWLGGTGVPAPRVLEWHREPGGAVLVTETVPGVPADDLAPADLARAWPSLLALVASLHALPVRGCPFERGIAAQLAEADAVVADGRVHTEYLPVPLQDVPPEDILAGLHAESAERLAQEAQHPVVVHGDLCLPNLLVDPSTHRATGLVDVGRLGVGDPHLDAALLLATARESWQDEATARHTGAALHLRLGLFPDTGRIDFFLRLDPLTW